MELNAELQKVSELISKHIAADSFPDQVRPDFLRQAMRDYPLRGGKRLRPAILLWSCSLLGGDQNAALPAAAAVEIFHNWTLVHDDIIDNDDLRRGQPTTHASLATMATERYRLHDAAARKFGTDFAILAGDLQHAWAYHALMSSRSTGVSLELAAALSDDMRKSVCLPLISGEALDVEFPCLGPDKLTETEIDRMLYLKTGALLRFSAETGARIALNDIEGSHPATRALGEYAASAGIAFQYRDDWLGIYGSVEKLGKPIGSDLAESKPTLLIVKAFQLLDAEGRMKLRSCLGRQRYDQKIIDQAKHLISESGAEAWLLERAAKLAVNAAAQLSTLPDNPYRQLLSELLNYLVGRHV